MVHLLKEDKGPQDIDYEPVVSKIMDTYMDHHLTPVSTLKVDVQGSQRKVGIYNSGKGVGVVSTTCFRSMCLSHRLDASANDKHNRNGH